jgi:AraC-like DNA-binding protein
MPDLFIRSVGRFESRGGFVYRQRSPRYCVHMITEGRGTFTADSRPYAVGKGELFIFLPGQVIQYADEPDAPWRYLWFAVEGSRAEWAFARTALSEGRQQFSAPGAIRSFVRELRDGFAENPQPPLLPIHAAWAFVRLFAEHFPAPAVADPGLAGRARIMMETDFPRGIGVEQVARALGVSRATLFRRFRKRYGLAPKEYLDRVRLEHARELLTQGGCTVREAAARCGYRDAAYFARACRKRFGHPPSFFRGSG